MNATRTKCFFDHSGQLRRPSYGQLASEMMALLWDHPAPPDIGLLPSGDGHVVLVIPAFLTGDWATSSFRLFLRACGLRAEGWGLGINWGPTPGILDGLTRRLSELREIEQGPLRIVGISLGGILARDRAHRRPDDLRQVISMASPWRLPTASNLEPLIHLAGRFYSPDIDPQRLRAPLSVPATSIFTRDDGIVAWQSCRADDSTGATDMSIQVSGAHTTICRNPQAMAAVVRRLAMNGAAMTTQSNSSAP